MIRKATLKDLEEITNIEKNCFPPSEACSKKRFKERLNTYPNNFYILEENNEIISFINGPLTKESNLTDEMYENPSFHNNINKWQMIFGVCTNLQYQHQGYASKLMRYVIEDAKNHNLNGLVLTCKKEKITFYEKFGFQNEGLSNSNHGNTTWYQMRLPFNKN